MGFVSQGGVYDWLHTRARWLWFGEVRLVSLHDCYTGFAGAAPQFISIGPYRFEYRFIDEYFVF